MRRLSLPLLLVAVVSCGGDDAVSPRVVSSVVLASPIGSRLAVGRTVQLVAEARDASGVAIDDATVSYAATPAGIVQVSAAGVVSGLAAGSAQVTATSGSVSQALDLQVVAADLAAVAATPDDALLQLLVANLTTAVSARVQTALQACKSGEVSGNFTVMESCAAGIHGEIPGAADPTDRVLLASAALYADRVLRLLNP